MIWFLMIATGLFTFGTRFIMLSSVASKRLPEWMHDALKYVPIAVLTAIIVPAVLVDPATHAIDLGPTPRLIAALAAAGVALLTRHVVSTILAGLATLWFLQWWL
jgi:branched-subunit amino acid transport protein